MTALAANNLLGLAVVAAFTSIAASERAAAQSDPQAGGNPGGASIGRALASELFLDIDENGDGSLSLPEALAFSGVVQARLDDDNDGALTFAEFADGSSWLDELAEYRGRTDRLETALRIVYDFWDRDNGGGLSAAEHQVGALNAFTYADLDRDLRLSEDEFLGGFVFAIAMRNALVE